MLKKISAFIPLLIFLVIVAFLYNSLDQKSANQNKLLIGNGQKIPLPEFQLVDLFDSNSKINKKDLPKRYILVNFFASWCSTCKKDARILEKLNKDIAVYGIIWNDVDQKARQYLQNNNNPYHKTFIDPQGKLAQKLQIKAIPHHFLIDPDGNIIYSIEGNLEPYIFYQIRQLKQQKL